MPSLVRRACTPPLQSPKYTTPSTTAGVLVTPDRPSKRQRGASWATFSGERFVSAGFARQVSRSWLKNGPSSATVAVGVALGVAVSVGVALAVSVAVAVAVPVAVELGGSVRVAVCVAVAGCVAVALGATAVDVLVEV